MFALFVNAQPRNFNKLEIQLSTRRVYSLYHNRLTELSEAILYQNVLHGKQPLKQS